MAIQADDGLPCPVACRSLAGPCEGLPDHAHAFPTIT